MNLKDYKHSYYCSDSNYYSNDAACTFTTWADFYEEYYDADVEYNLIFRWDIKQREESKRYWMEIFIMHQRKGIYRPITISYLDEKDMPQVENLLKKHWDYLKNLWNPIYQGVTYEL